MIKKPFLSDDDFGPILIGKMSKIAQKGHICNCFLVTAWLPCQRYIPRTLQRVRQGCFNVFCVRWIHFLFLKWVVKSPCSPNVGFLREKVIIQTANEVTSGGLCRGEWDIGHCWFPPNVLSLLAPAALRDVRLVPGRANRAYSGAGWHMTQEKGAVCCMEWGTMQGLPNGT